MLRIDDIQRQAVDDMQFLAELMIYKAYALIYLRKYGIIVQSEVKIL